MFSHVSTKRHKRSDPIAIPTGKSPDGTIYFNADDLARGNGKVSLPLLPVGNIPLMCHPTYPYNNSFGIYKEEPFPVFCIEEAGSHHRKYKCQYVIRRDKKGNATKLCEREWGESASFNISSLLTHGPSRPCVSNEEMLKDADAPHSLSHNFVAFPFFSLLIICWHLYLQ